MMNTLYAETTQINDSVCELKFKNQDYLSERSVYQLLNNLEKSEKQMWLSEPASFCIKGERSKINM